jgi:type IV pilus assembly protein PilM
MSLFGSSEPSYIGVDIGAGGIKLVELKKTKDRPQLWTYGIAENPIDIHVDNSDSTPDEHKNDNGEIILPEEQEQSKEPQEELSLEDERIEKSADILKDLVDEAGVEGEQVTASLPVSYIFHTIVTIPDDKDEQKDDIIKAEVDKLISRPVEQMQIVHQKINKKNGDDNYMRFLVTAAPKDLVRFYTAIFQKAGLQLQELETEAFSLQRSLVGNDPATVLVVDIGSERSNFFIMDEGLPMTHRSIEVGGETIDEILQDITGLEDKMISQVKKDMSKLNEDELDYKKFSKMTEPVIKEIEYGFDLYSHQTVDGKTKKPEKIILTGGSAFFPPVAKALEEYFDLKVFIGDPWARLVYQQGLKPILDDIGPRMAVSVGLSLRNLV